MYNQHYYNKENQQSQLEITQIKEQNNHLQLANTNQNLTNKSNTIKQTQTSRKSNT